MEREKALKNIALYKWYVLLKQPLLWGPILISALTQLGHMTLDEIYFMEAVVLLGFIFLDTPSGALADYIGRKKMVVIGAFLEVVSITWFACIQTPFDVWGANLVWMVGYSFASGANTGLIYDTLIELDLEHTYEDLESKSTARFLFVSAFFSLLAGVLAEIDLRLPILLSIPGTVLCLYVACNFTETGTVKEKLKRKKISVKEILMILKTGLRSVHNLTKISLFFVANNKEIKWIIAFSTLVTVASKVWFFSYNPYFELLELDVRYYGVLFFLLNMFAWYFCKKGPLIRKKIGQKNVILIFLLSVSVPIIVMGTWTSVVVVGLILTQTIIRGMSKAFFGSMLHARITSENRATVDSLSSAANGLFQFIALGVYGFALDVFGLPYSLQILGYVVLILGVYALYKYRIIFVSQ